MGVGSVMVLMGKTYQDATLEYKFVASLGFFAICSTETPITGIIARHVYMAWLDRHPEREQDNMGSAAMRAFREAWPCEKSN